MPTFRTSQLVSAADPSRPHLILVGLPGAGKSTVAKAVAEILGRTFLDMDAEIERREGCSVADIFGHRGEPYFRVLERGLTVELALTGNMILAPGGGWASRPDVVALLRPPSSLIYLKVSPDIALARLGSERATRPLLMRPDPRSEMRRLLEAREQAYLSADHVIDTDLLNLQRVIEKVAALATGV